MPALAAACSNPRTNSSASGASALKSFRSLRACDIFIALIYKRFDVLKSTDIMRKMEARQTRSPNNEANREPRGDRSQNPDSQAATRRRDGACAANRATSLSAAAGQAATRLTLERSLAGLGVTPPQFVVLTMLRAYRGCPAPIWRGWRC